MIARLEAHKLKHFMKMKTEDVHSIVNDLNKAIRSIRENRKVESGSYLAAIPRMEKLYGPMNKMSISLTFNGKMLLYNQSVGRVVDDSDKDILISQCIRTFQEQLFISLLDQRPKWEFIIMDKELQEEDGIG